MDDFAADALVTAAIGDHAADQRFGLGRVRDPVRRGLAAGARDQREHAALGHVVEETGRIVAKECGFCAGGDFLPFGCDQPPGSDQSLAQLVVSPCGH